MSSEPDAAAGVGLPPQAAAPEDVQDVDTPTELNVAVLLSPVTNSDHTFHLFMKEHVFVDAQRREETETANFDISRADLLAQLEKCTKISSASVERATLVATWRALPPLPRTWNTDNTADVLAQWGKAIALLGEHAEFHAELAALCEKGSFRHSIVARLLAPVHLPERLTFPCRTRVSFALATEGVALPHAITFRVLCRPSARPVEVISNVQPRTDTIEMTPDSANQFSAWVTIDEAVPHELMFEPLQPDAPQDWRLIQFPLDLPFVMSTVAPPPPAIPYAASLDLVAPVVWPPVDITPAEGQAGRPSRFFVVRLRGRIVYRRPATTAETAKGLLCGVVYPNHRSPVRGVRVNSGQPITLDRSRQVVDFEILVPAVAKGQSVLIQSALEGFGAGECRLPQPLIVRLPTDVRNDDDEMPGPSHANSSPATNSTSSPVVVGEPSPMTTPQTTPRERRLQPRALENTLPTVPAPEIESKPVVAVTQLSVELGVRSTLSGHDLFVGDSVPLKWSLSALPSDFTDVILQQDDDHVDFVSFNESVTKLRLKYEVPELRKPSPPSGKGKGATASPGPVPALNLDGLKTVSHEVDIDLIYTAKCFVSLVDGATVATSWVVGQTEQVHLRFNFEGFAGQGNEVFHVPFITRLPARLQIDAAPAAAVPNLSWLEIARAEPSVVLGVECLEVGYPDLRVGTWCHNLEVVPRELPILWRLPALCTVGQSCDIEIETTAEHTVFFHGPGVALTEPVRVVPRYTLRYTPAVMGINYIAVVVDDGEPFDLPVYACAAALPLPGAVPVASAETTVVATMPRDRRMGIHWHPAAGRAVVGANTEHTLPVFDEICGYHSVRRGEAWTGLALVRRPLSEVPVAAETPAATAASKAATPMSMYSMTSAHSTRDFPGTPPPPPEPEIDMFYLDPHHRVSEMLWMSDEKNPPVSFAESTTLISTANGELVSVGRTCVEVVDASSTPPSYTKLTIGGLPEGTLVGAFHHQQLYCFLVPMDDSTRRVHIYSSDMYGEDGWKEVEPSDLQNVPRANLVHWQVTSLNDTVAYLIEKQLWLYSIDRSAWTTTSLPTSLKSAHSLAIMHIGGVTQVVVVSRDAVEGHIALHIWNTVLNVWWQALVEITTAVSTPIVMDNNLVFWRANSKADALTTMHTMTVTSNDLETAWTFMAQEAALQVATDVCNRHLVATNRTLLTAFVNSALFSRVLENILTTCAPYAPYGRFKYPEATDPHFDLLLQSVMTDSVFTGNGYALLERFLVPMLRSLLFHSAGGPQQQKAYELCLELCRLYCRADALEYLVARRHLVATTNQRLFARLTLALLSTAPNKNSLRRLLRDGVFDFVVSLIDDKNQFQDESVPEVACALKLLLSLDIPRAGLNDMYARYAPQVIRLLHDGLIPAPLCVDAIDVMHGARKVTVTIPAYLPILGGLKNLSGRAEPDTVARLQEAMRVLARVKRHFPARCDDIEKAIVVALSDGCHRLVLLRVWREFLAARADRLKEVYVRLGLGVAEDFAPYYRIQASNFSEREPTESALTHIDMLQRNLAHNMLVTLNAEYADSSSMDNSGDYVANFLVKLKEELVKFTRAFAAIYGDLKTALKDFCDKAEYIQRHKTQPDEEAIKKIFTGKMFEKLLLTMMIERDKRVLNSDGIVSFHAVWKYFHTKPKGAAKEGGGNTEEDEMTFDKTGFKDSDYVPSELLLQSSQRRARDDLVALTLNNDFGRYAPSQRAADIAAGVQSAKFNQPTSVMESIWQGAQAFFTRIVVPTMTGLVSEVPKLLEAMKQPDKPAAGSEKPTADAVTTAAATVASAANALTSVSTLATAVTAGAPLAAAATAAVAATGGTAVVALPLAAMGAAMIKHGSAAARAWLEDSSNPETRAKAFNTLIDGICEQIMEVLQPLVEARIAQCEDFLTRSVGLLKEIMAVIIEAIGALEARATLVECARREVAELVKPVVNEPLNAEVVALYFGVALPATAQTEPFKGPSKHLAAETAARQVEEYSQAVEAAMSAVRDTLVHKLPEPISTYKDVLQRQMIDAFGSAEQQAGMFVKKSQTKAMTKHDIDLETLTTVSHCAYFSNAVYEADGETFDAGLISPEYTYSKLFSRNGPHTGLLRRNVGAKEADIFVIFRGTHTKADGVIDAKCAACPAVSDVISQSAAELLVPKSNVPNTFNVHMGIWHALCVGLIDIINAIAEIHAQIVADRRKIRHLILTGHSLGGGYAQLLALVLHLFAISYKQQTLALPLPYVFSFGSPQVIQNTSDAMLAIMHPKSIAFINDNDIVPRLLGNKDITKLANLLIKIPFVPGFIEAFKQTANVATVLAEAATFRPTCRVIHLERLEREAAEGSNGKEEQQFYYEMRHYNVYKDACLCAGSLNYAKCLAYIQTEPYMFMDHHSMVEYARILHEEVYPVFYPQAHPLFPPPPPPAAPVATASSTATDTTAAGKAVLASNPPGESTRVPTPERRSRAPTPTPLTDTTAGAGNTGDGAAAQPETSGGSGGANSTTEASGRENSAVPEPDDRLDPF